MKQIDDIWWPDEDVECHRVVPGQVKDIEHALKYVKGRTLCVQAGGNVGIWPLYLSGRFEKVVTAEPDRENFACLSRNIGRADNITAHMVAFGDARRVCALERTPKNAGAHQIIEGLEDKMITIDELKLPACDLIILDVEGYEPKALEGAKKTIEIFRPVIMVGDKGLTERYGTPKGWADSFPGYKVAKKVHRDVVLTPE